jgi:hypothetical protein
MVRVTVGQDDVAHRQPRDLSDGRAQLFTIGEAAARVEHRHGAPTDHESDVGDGTAVCGARVLVDAAAEKNAARNFGYRERCAAFFRRVR